MIKSLHTATAFSKEVELYAPVAHYMRKQGFDVQHPELPFYEYRIDLYSFCVDTDRTVAIELKLNDWKRALEQAMLYQLCADLVYVAMPLRNAARLDAKLFLSYGVGLIGVTNALECDVIVPAAKHDELRDFYRSKQLSYLQGESNA